MDGQVLALDWLDAAALAAVLGVIIYFLVTWLSKKSTKEPTTKSPLDESEWIDNIATKMKNMDAKMVVFYGSQTGTAEEYATRLAQDARKYGIRAVIADFEDYEMETLNEVSEIENSLAVFCLATYGEGDPTDNAQVFYDTVNEKIQEQEEWDLSNLKYAVFGLGNSTYEHYNAVAKWLDKSLPNFGATRIGELGLGDDDKALEEDFVNWKDQFWPIACEHFGVDPEGSGVSLRQYTLEIPDSVPSDKVYVGEQTRLGSYKNQKRPFNAKNPYLAPLAVKKELYDDDERSCLHLELDFKDAGLKYAAGDHVAVYPENNHDLVQILGDRMGVDLDQVVKLVRADEFVRKKEPFPCPCSYRTALTHYVDITSHPGLNVLQEMIQYAEEEHEKTRLIEMTSKDGRAQYRSWITDDCRSVVQVLVDLPSVKMPMDHLLELLPRLQPRYYSISSSPKLHPTTIHVTAAVVRYETRVGNKMEGVATTWFERLSQSQTLPAFVRPSKFRLPNRHLKPVIMIGPGTGVAPFRGFIQERAAIKARGDEIGPMLLFFGCQHEKKHYMYKDELENYESEGVVEIFTAFSRDQPQKVYVQHRLKEQGARVFELLRHDAYIYVCGDAKHMARDVHATLINIIKTYGNKSESIATDILKGMESKRRYQQDVWS